jgi:carbonic anhydrase
MCSRCLPALNQLSRRRLIRGSAVFAGAVAVSATGTHLLWTGITSADDATPVTHSDEDAHWTYEGDDGPEHWGDLDPDYAACSSGHAQSPIDIEDPTDKDLVNITVQYQPVSPMRILNNGHTIQVNIDPGSSIEVDGVAYDLVQFHFHAPSEHTIAGEHQPMELHLVHKTAGGATAVVGVLLKEGSSGTPFEPVFNAMPVKAGPEEIVETDVNPADFLPSSGTTYRYSGSLTTPPCTEGVTWLIFTEPTDIAADQVAAFHKIFSANNRPTQPLNDRTVEEDSSA